MTVRIGIDVFLDDPQLLGPHFEGASWDRWRACLRAAFALPMTGRDKVLFAEVSGGRAPPTRPVREFVAAVGRGGGKDAVASALATYIAATSDFSRLRGGEKAVVLCLATDRDQAAIAANYIRSYFEQVPLLAGLVDRTVGDTIDLTNRCSIIIGTSNYRAVRGRTIGCAIYDEVAFWYGDDYASPDTDTDGAVSPGLMRFPGSIKVLISSVHKRSGLLYDRVARFFGKDDPDTLVVMGESLQFNPTLDAEIINRELERDYERASAEYLCRWRDDLSGFLDRELVEAAVDRGIAVRPARGYGHQVFVDPSGGRGDSFTAAVAHAEGNTVTVDTLYERRAPFDPSLAVGEVAELARNYRQVEVTGDRYAAEWVVEAFRKVGITYRQSERDRSAIYLDALPLFTAGRVRLVDNQRLIHQLISLERRTTRMGRDIVCHQALRDAHDDVANAACGAMVLVAKPDEVSRWIRAFG